MKLNMKLKSILFTLFSVAVFSGCGDVRDVRTYYTYGNATDRSITVECFTRISDEDADPVYRKDTSFVIAPDKEFTLMLDKGHIAYPFEFPGSYHGRYITYSNGEKTFTQEAYKPEYTYRNPLFNIYTYTKISESLNGCYYQYTFTDADFEDYE